MFSLNSALFADKHAAFSCGAFAAFSHVSACASFNSPEKTSESGGAADARRTFPEEDFHCKL